MVRFVLGRLGLLVIGLAVSSVIIFGTLRVLPGDVAQVVGGLKATPDDLARIRANLGLDTPLPIQYAHWIAGITHLDLGRSLLTGTPVAAQLAEKFQVTLPLAVLSIVVALLVALPLGMLSAVHRHRRIGRALNVVAQIGAAVPALWLGMLLVLLLGHGIGIIGVLPNQGFPRDGWNDPGTAFLSLILPAVTAGIIEGAVLLRYVRSATLEALAQDFVRAAAAKGRTRTRALLRVGLPNVGLSIISVTALTVAGLVTGAVLVESLFNLPGVGRMLVTDVGNRDLAKVQSEILVLTAIVLVIGALIDIVHRIIDPRQREAAS